MKSIRLLLTISFGLTLASAAAHAQARFHFDPN
jgi:hypothetical protein